MERIRTNEMVPPKLIQACTNLGEPHSAPKIGIQRRHIPKVSKPREFPERLAVSPLLLEGQGDQPLLTAEKALIERSSLSGIAANHR